MPTMKLFDVLSWVVVLFGVGQVIVCIAKQRGRVAAILNRRNKKLLTEFLCEADRYRQDKFKSWKLVCMQFLIALSLGFISMMFNSLGIVARHPEHQTNIAIIFTSSFVLLMVNIGFSIDRIHLFEKYHSNQDKLNDDANDGDDE